MWWWGSAQWCAEGRGGRQGLRQRNAASPSCLANASQRALSAPRPPNSPANKHSLGADGVMVPLVNSRADAERAVAACKYAPQGERSVAYPVRAVYRKGTGAAALAEYLRTANRETEARAAGSLLMSSRSPRRVRVHAQTHKLKIHHKQTQTSTATTTNKQTNKRRSGCRSRPNSATRRSTTCCPSRASPAPF